MSIGSKSKKVKAFYSLSFMPRARSPTLQLLPPIIGLHIHASNYQSPSLGSFRFRLVAPRNYTALSGTHLHLGGVKQCRVNFLLKEISSALREVSNPGPFDP